MSTLARSAASFRHFPKRPFRVLSFTWRKDKDHKNLGRLPPCPGAGIKSKSRKRLTDPVQLDIIHRHAVLCPTSATFSQPPRAQPRDKNIPSLPYTAYTRPSSTLPRSTDDVIDVNELAELITSAPCLPKNTAPFSWPNHLPNTWYHQESPTSSSKPLSHCCPTSTRSVFKRHARNWSGEQPKKLEKKKKTYLVRLDDVANISRHLLAGHGGLVVFVVGGDQGWCSR